MEAPRAERSGPLGSPSEPRPRLSGRLSRGGVFALAEYAASRVIRLAANVALARLLFPEAFGLMAIVTSAMQGLEMLSDVGIRPSIVHHARGADPAFLRTAWTIQLLRGGALWVCTWILAAPFARIYAEPMLFWLLPFAGLAAPLTGLQSTRLSLATRDLRLGRLAALNTGSYLAGVGVMLAWAWWSPTVWALAAAGVVTAGVRSAASHLWLPGPRSRLGWDRQVAGEIARFGRWIVLSTALTFVAGQGDRLFLGLLFSTAFLGVFGIAANLSRVVVDLLKYLSTRLLFPYYADLVRRGADQDLARRSRRLRLAMLATTWAVMLPVAALAQPIVDLLFDSRYAAAGWVLQLLAAGALCDSVNLSYGGLLLAHGRSRDSALLMAGQVVAKYAAIALGFAWRGPAGAVLGLALSGAVAYPATAYCFRRIGMWQPRLDLPATTLSLLLVLLAAGAGGNPLAP